MSKPTCSSTLCPYYLCVARSTDAVLNCPGCFTPICNLSCIHLDSIVDTGHLFKRRIYVCVLVHVCLSLSLIRFQADQRATDGMACAYAFGTKTFHRIQCQRCAYTFFFSDGPACLLNLAHWSAATANIIISVQDMKYNFPWLHCVLFRFHKCLVQY